MPEFCHNRVETLVLGREFLYPQTQEFVLQNYRGSRYRDALYIELDRGEVWLFDYGVLICWGISDDSKQTLVKQLSNLVDDRLNKPEFEQYRFELNVHQVQIHADTLFLASDDMMQRLAASHAFAQSVKLRVLETMAQQVIEANEYIPRSLARDGKIPLRRRDLAKLRGILFSTKHDIVLNFNLLDTPEFFWDYSELEPLYLQVARYLDVLPRVTLLNKKLETIHELLEMIASEQQHLHSSKLEWIIIILIAVEIVLFFWH